ncbi:DEAD/DEAH box helicase [Listeria sp. SHR_NRA_18]|uniref:DEAD/DEAH box helicase n=1 Tax=Listeria newyorkensis TaxID=1497681 RepID=A0A841YY90_9LIST|nr:MULTISPECIES: DEAD/DEAH box helicase [Listeria]KMT63048.1 putative ATP-dependent RNA helicase [Listeria newyorkensis]MBC1458278.1 DEAD/DEAH box helicase [Listeria newyorkensis]RQW65673.1 DEAD/DEAH box helicase [Listeria sp. SHR_NRA_18]
MTIKEVPEIWAEQWKAHNYEEMTEIQQQLYTPIKEGKDVIAVSPTGTGKTVAYSLPAIEKLEVKPHTQWLILAPSHELVMQIADVVRSWLPAGLKVIGIIGSANIKRQIDNLKKKPQVIVGSPGRVLELIKQKKIKMHEVKMITLDECDQLLIRENVPTVLEIVNSAMRDRQLVMASATKLDDPMMFYRNSEIEPVMIEAKAEESNANVNHLYMDVEQPRDKAILLRRISNVEGMHALVFVKDKVRMDIILEKLQYDGVAAAGIHGEVDKEKRKKYLAAFKKAELTYLVVTDVAARGLDIPDLPFVIHCDVAMDAKQYTHRSGRTGRMGKEGTVLSFANEREARTLRQYLKELNKDPIKVRYYEGVLTDDFESKAKRK